MKNKYLNKKTAEYYKAKKILFAPWGACNKYYAAYQMWHPALNQIFGELVSFDPQQVMQKHGKKKMNEMFLEIIEKEKPDFIWLWLILSEFYPETIQKIKVIAPSTIIIGTNYDDDSQFDDFFRYYSCFFDYSVIGEKNYLQIYKKEGINNVFCSMGVSNQIFKKLNNIKKIYDVTFIGSPKGNRANYIRFLKDKKINIKIFGAGWDKYPEFNDIYGGKLNSEDLVKVLNQSKITLSFTKNYYGVAHFNPRVFESASAGAFTLIEYYEGYETLFKKEVGIVRFNSEKELLDKVNYFLDYEKERQILSDKLHKIVIEKFSTEYEFAKIFSEIYRSKKTKINIPDYKQKVYEINIEAFINSKLKIKIDEDYEFVTFKSKNLIKSSQLRHSIQIHSLIKTNKNISISGYYIQNYFLGDYLYIYAKSYFNKTNPKQFAQFIEPSAILITKEEFYSNYNKWKDLCKNKKSDLFNSKNIAFVSLPLVYVSKLINPPLESNKTIISEYYYEIKSLLKRRSLKIIPFLMTLFFISLKKENGFILKDFKEFLKKHIEI